MYVVLPAGLAADLGGCACRGLLSAGSAGTSAGSCGGGGAGRAGSSAKAPPAYGPAWGETPARFADRLSDYRNDLQPAAISLLLIHLRKGRFKGFAANEPQADDAAA